MRGLLSSFGGVMHRWLLKGRSFCMHLADRLWKTLLWILNASMPSRRVVKVIAKTPRVIKQKDTTSQAARAQMVAGWETNPGKDYFLTAFLYTSNLSHYQTG